MSTETVLIIAIISPRKGQFNQVLDLVKHTLIKGVKSREPDCLEFYAHQEVNPQSDLEEIFMYEKFRNGEAVAFHQKNPAFLEFAKELQEKDLLEKPLFVKIVKPTAGFSKA